MTQNFDNLSLETPEEVEARVRNAEQGGEALSGAGGDTQPVELNAEQFAADTLAAVAHSNEATMPTPEVEAEIVQIEHELRGAGNKETVNAEQVEMLANEYRSEYVRIGGIVNDAIKNFDKAVTQYGREDQRTTDKKAQWDYVVRHQAEVGKQISDLMSEFPDSEKYFRTGG